MTCIRRPLDKLPEAIIKGHPWVDHHTEGHLTVDLMVILLTLPTMGI